MFGEHDFIDVNQVIVIFDDFIKKYLAILK